MTIPNGYNTMPVAGYIEELLSGANTLGSVFYVDSNTGSDSSGYGTNVNTPVATLDYAIALCTANKGDIIVVMPGHSETYSSTGTKLTVDVAGVTIIGLGKGASRPTFTFTHTGATWVISSASATLKNLLLVTGVDSVVVMATISGADCTIEDIECRDTTDVETIDNFIVTGARFTAKRCYFNGYTGGNANARNFKLNGATDALIERCRFIGKVTTACINFVTNFCYNIIIKECDFLVTSTTDLSKTVVDTKTSCTWEVRDCFDLAAGSMFSGGSGAALAGDDMSSVYTRIGAPAGASIAADISVIAGKLDSATLAVAPTAGSIASFIASGGVALGSQLPSSKSLYDEVMQHGDGYVTSKTINFTGASSYNIFSVTGVVAVKIIGVISAATSNITSTAGVGTASSASGLLADTAGTAMQTANQIWVDSGPSKFETFPANYTALSGEAIAVTVTGAAALTTGGVTFYCFWRPVSATGAVALT